MTDVKATGVINYTTTGTKTNDLFIASPTDEIVFGVTVNTGPAVFDIEVQLQTGGKWFKEVENASATGTWLCKSRIKNWRLVIDTLDAGSLDFEAVRVARR